MVQKVFRCLESFSRDSQV